MRIRRTVPLSGLDFSLVAGDVVEVPDLVGQAWCGVGHAEEAHGDMETTAVVPGLETTEAGDVETAATRTTKKPGKATKRKTSK